MAHQSPPMQIRCIALYCITPYTAFVFTMARLEYIVCVAMDTDYRNTCRMCFKKLESWTLHGHMTFMHNLYHNFNAPQAKFFVMHNDSDDFLSGFSLFLSTDLQTF